MSTTDLPPGAGRTQGISTSASTAAEDRPDCERGALSRMRPKWELPDLLLGGTTAMQEARTRVLPQEQEESDEEYSRRIQRTVLTNYYGNTLDTHSGMPFSTAITFDPPLPERMAYLERDADGCGRSITVFARDHMRDAMHRGLSHVLVDVPPGPSDSHRDVLKRQPRLVHIETGALLGIQDRPGGDGEDVVTYARFVQQHTEAKGKFGEVARKQIIEIEVGGDATTALTITWERNEDGTWQALEPTRYTQDVIPLFTLYANQVGEYEGEPAYSYLAELNKAHYQSDADQRHALSYGRRATVVQTGWKDAGTGPAEAAARAAGGGGSATKRDALGYGRKMRNPNDASKAYLLETNGAPLAAGQLDLDKLEERMERFGASQISKGGGITATSRQLDDKRDTCNLQAWCTRQEGVLLGAVRAVAKWLGITLPENQKVKIPRDFADTGPKPENFTHVAQLGRDGMLAPVDVLQEGKACGILTTIGDPEEAAERAASWKEQNSVLDMERRASNALAGEPEAPAAPEPDGEPDAEVTLNEITLGIERLGRLGDAKLMQAMRERLAEKLGIGSPGKFVSSKVVAAAAAGPGANAA